MPERVLLLGDDLRAFLAIALLNDPSDQGPVGQASPSASVAVPAPSATIVPTLPPPEPSVAPSVDAQPSETPIASRAASPTRPVKVSTKSSTGSP